MIYKVDAAEWDSVKAAAPGDFASLSAGGYVCQIINAEFGTSKSGNDMLILHVDIAEGDFADYFVNTVKRFNQENWPNAATYRQLVLGNDKKFSSFFKGFIKIVEQCNPGFVAYKNGGIDDKAFVGKMCGFVFVDEEYIKQDKSVGVRTIVRTPKTLDDIREGNFKVPPRKKLDADKAPAHKSSYGEPPASPNIDINANAPTIENPPFDNEEDPF